MAVALCVPDPGVLCYCSISNAHSQLQNSSCALPIHQTRSRLCSLPQLQPVQSCNHYLFSKGRSPMLPRTWTWSCKTHRRNRSVLIIQMNSKKDECLYSVLGLAPSASQKDLKQAYRRLALRYHPDVNKEPGALDRFLHAKQAYQTLVDPISRAKYDASREASESRNKYNWNFQGGYTKGREEEEFYGLDEFFRDLEADLNERESAASSQAKSKSLWEELAEIGEEFVELLEKELKIEPENMQPRESGVGFDNNLRTQSATSKNLNGNQSKQETMSTAEVQVDEIEEILSQLKRELGL
ncbi:hypothetical protein O6H91_14G011600 [Diphasiastrum complanatum]|uniref:Uncharacterized protein n=1 Tax=Diphasiastrum complanatum TaxID=34168 RepID=A0ACC2BLN6_DIPCM|nr:hypothetical protein O6H91_14G011600 [Diphasiastrum complanatum]